MQLSFALKVTTVAIGALTACFAGQLSLSGIQKLPNREVQTTHPQTSFPQAIYVASSNKIYVFTPGASSPRLTISGGLANVTQIAIGKGGRRYASNFGTSNTNAGTSETEYTLGQTSPALTRTNGAFSASGVAVDRSGDVFVSSYYRDTVSVYHPGETDPFRQITQGINAPDLLAAHDQDLFVGESGYAKILRFPDDATLQLEAPGPLPLGALTYGGQFVVGPDGSVYAAGAVIASDLGFEEFVNVFAPKATAPRISLAVAQGRSAGSAPYVAIYGNSLYVSSFASSAVFEYEIGSNLKLVRTIMEVNPPGPIAVDPKGNLFVGSPGGTVAIYPPGKTTPSQIIDLPGFDTPVSIVIG